MRKRKKDKIVEKVKAIVKKEGQLFKCPSCSNTKRFYEKGLARVKVELEQYGGGLDEISTDVESFIGNVKTFCSECNAEVSSGSVRLIPVGKGACIRLESQIERINSKTP